MTTATSSAAGRADTEALLSAAAVGDAEAFQLLTAPHRRELLVHCTGCWAASITPTTRFRKLC
jgi:hypothetical protein